MVRSNKFIFKGVFRGQLPNYNLLPTKKSHYLIINYIIILFIYYKSLDVFYWIGFSYTIENKIIIFGICPLTFKSLKK